MLDNTYFPGKLLRMARAVHLVRGAQCTGYMKLEQEGIRLLADIGAADSVKVISRRTNGYRDIQIGAVYNAGRSFSTTYMKYNGTIYK